MCARFAAEGYSAGQSQVLGDPNFVTLYFICHDIDLKLREATACAGSGWLPKGMVCDLTVQQQDNQMPGKAGPGASILCRFYPGMGFIKAHRQARYYCDRDGENALPRVLSTLGTNV